MNKISKEYFKIRASGIGSIMGGGGITDIQKAKIATLQAKPKLTDNQEKELAKLIHKRDNSVLPDGAKTYCKEWVLEKVFGRKKSFSGKQTEKGTIVEQDGIDFLAGIEEIATDSKKYGKRITNDPDIEGEPDVVNTDTVIDIKSPWDLFTMPYFEDTCPTKAYEWQLQGYMAILNKSKAELIYVLCDTPEYLIDKEIYFKVKNLEAAQGGYVSQEDVARITDNTRRLHIFGDIAPENRFKRYKFERGTEKEQQIRDRVKECRKYIGTLLDSLYK